MLKCWKKDPNERPDFDEIVDILTTFSSDASDSSENDEEVGKLEKDENAAEDYSRTPVLQLEDYANVS